MKLFFIIIPILFLGFASCDSDSSGSQSNQFSPGAVDARLQPFLNQFIDEASKRGVTINSDRLNSLALQFGALEPNTLGTCVSGGAVNEITINERISDEQIKWVVIHELGHCILRMEHRNDILSIMNTTLSSARLDNLGEEAAFDEFFQQRFFEAY